MRKILIAIVSYLSFVAVASAQSNPGWEYGFVPTPAQWNAELASKQDFLGGSPCLITGCTMTGPLITAASTTLGAGLNLQPGVAPTSPFPGDMWLTSTGLFVQIGSTTVDLIGGTCTGTGAFRVGTGSASQCSTTAGSTATLQVGATASSNNQLNIFGYQAAVQVKNQAGTQNGYFGIDDADGSKLKLGFGYSAGQGLPPYIVLDSTNGQQVNIGIATYHGFAQSVFNTYSDDATFGSNDNVGTFIRNDTLSQGAGAYLNIVHFSGTNPAQPALITFASRGTMAAPVALGSGDQTIVIDPHGYAGTGGWIDQASGINFPTTQAWSNIGNGAKIVFFTTPNNSLSGRVNSWTMDQDGSLYSAGQSSGGAGTVTAAKIFASLGGVGTTIADGLVTANPTAAALGAQQNSPCVRLSGNGWATGSSTSLRIDWCLQNAMIQGASNPSSLLAFNVSINGGGFTSAATLSSGGVFNVATQYNVNGSQIACANLANSGDGCTAATMTATVGGLVPTPPNNTTTFLRGDGTFAAAAAGSLTGSTLAAGVTASSLTSLGTITTLTATTINGFTLAGTVAGGGNQLNNVIVGTTTPLAGFFTTLSATTSLTSPIHSGGSAANSTLTLQSTSGAGTTDSIVFKTGSQVTALTIDTSQNSTFTLPLGSTITVNGPTGNGSPVEQIISPSTTAFQRGQLTFFRNSNGGAIANGTWIGGVNYFGFDGTSNLGSANFTVIADNTVSTGVVPLGFVFQTGTNSSPTTRMTISSAGITSFSTGTASTSKTTGDVVVTGGVGIGGALFTNTLSVITMANAATTSAVCYNPGTGLFTYNSTVGTCTVSTLAAKNLIAPMTPKEGFDIVMSMEPWRYTMKEGRPTYLPGEQIGMVAEYARKVDARLVAVNPDDTVAGFRYEQYTAALTAAFKYLKEDNDNLHDQLRRRHGN